MDAMFLDLQIQVRVGETAGAPMFGDDNVAWLGLAWVAVYSIAALLIILAWAYVSA